MGWFDRIFGSRAPNGDASDKPSGASDRITDMVNTLGKAGRLGELEQELSRFNVALLSDKEVESWHTMMIAAAFRRGDRAAAHDRALVASRALPNSSEIAFAVGQEHEYRGEIDEMVYCFQRAPFPQVSAAHTLAAARYCYLRGRLAEGVALIKPLLETYFELKIADDTFLWLRGMPFASVAFSTGLCLRLLNGDVKGARALIVRATKELSDCDLTDLVPLVEANAVNDASIAVGALLAEQAHAGMLAGFRALQIAVWRARTLGTMSDVDTTLTRVTVGENDFRWLHDIRTLAYAEAYHRFGDDKKEAATLQRFIEKQPLLFEPEWVFKFGFIQYQERVRSSFWLHATGRIKPAV